MGVQLAGPVIKSPGYRVEKLVESAECLRCSWPIEHGETALLVAEDLVFCSARCYRASFDAPFDLGGES